MTDEQVEATWRRLVAEAEASGYYVNPDDTFAKDLVRGLLKNEERYGYRSCPCRLASGVREQDRDIICPCDYRDFDLEEFGTCYCALYVAPAIARGDRKAGPIPDRRPMKENPAPSTMERVAGGGLPFPVWRCRVCGYLCARPQPPLVCPVCKAGQERFERFL